MKNFIPSLFSRPRPIVVRTRLRALNDEELRAAFGGVSEEHPLWIAIHQELEGLIESAVEQGSAPGMAEHHGPLAHTMGGVEWLKFFRDRLEDRLQESRRQEG